MTKRIGSLCVAAFLLWLWRIRSTLMRVGNAINGLVQNASFSIVIAHIVRMIAFWLVCDIECQPTGFSHSTPKLALIWLLSNRAICCFHCCVMDWLNMVVANVCVKRLEFLTCDRYEVATWILLSYEWRHVVRLRYVAVFCRRSCVDWVMWTQMVKWVSTTECIRFHACISLTISATCIARSMDECDACGFQDDSQTIMFVIRYNATGSFSLLSTMEKIQNFDLNFNKNHFFCDDVCVCVALWAKLVASC